VDATPYGIITTVFTEWSYYMYKEDEKKIQSFYADYTVCR